METQQDPKQKLENDITKYLDELRDSGEVNMFGASPYLMEEFELTKSEARQALSKYMQQD